jgi:hypothetical protein
MRSISVSRSQRSRDRAMWPTTPIPTRSRRSSAPSSSEAGAKRSGAVAHWLPGRRRPGHAPPPRWRSSGPAPREARRARSPRRGRVAPVDGPRTRADARRPQTQRHADRAAFRPHPPARASRREAPRPGPLLLARNLRCGTTTPQRRVPRLRYRRVPRSPRPAPCGRCRSIAGAGPRGHASRRAFEPRRAPRLARCTIAARGRAGPVSPRPPPPRRRRRGVTRAAEPAGARTR